MGCLCRHEHFEWIKNIPPTQAERIISDIRSSRDDKVVALAADGAGWMVISSAFCDGAAAERAGWHQLTRDHVRCLCLVARGECGTGNRITTRRPDG